MTPPALQFRRSAERIDRRHSHATAPTAAHQHPSSAWTLKTIATMRVKQDAAGRFPDGRSACIDRRDSFTDDAQLRCQRQARL